MRMAVHRTMLKGGEMVKGFGLIAWPAEYGKTGVMSFIVNQEGQALSEEPRTANGARGWLDQIVRS